MVEMGLTEESEMSKTKFRVIAKQPFVERHGDFSGRTMTDLVAASTEERADAEIIARALRAAGWDVEVRRWSSHQRKCQDRLGRWRWYAGYVECPL